MARCEVSVLCAEAMLDRVDKVLAVAVPSKVFHREAVARLYVIVSLCLYVAALELERAVLYVGFGDRRRVFLVNNFFGGNLLDFLRVVALRVVLPRIPAPDFERDVLHRRRRRKAPAVHNAPARAGRSRKLPCHARLCPRTDYRLSPFEDYVVVARRYFSLHINSIALAPDRLPVLAGELSDVVIVSDVPLLRVVVLRAEFLDLGFQIMIRDDFFYDLGCCLAFKCLCAYALVQPVQFCFYLDFHLGRTVLTEPRRKARYLA